MKFKLLNWKKYVCGSLNSSSNSFRATTPFICYIYFRVDTTLLGFDHNSWVRGNRTYIFKGNL